MTTKLLKVTSCTKHQYQCLMRIFLRIPPPQKKYAHNIMYVNTHACLRNINFQLKSIHQMSRNEEIGTLLMQA